MKAVVHEEHLERDHWWFRARRDIFRDFLAEQVALPSAARVLDLGPGSGVNLEVLEPLGALVNLDLSRVSLERLPPLGDHGSLVQGNAEQLPFRSGSVDLVCALDVLEHLDDDLASLSDIRRVLAPTGALFFSVPAHPWMWGRQDVLAEHRRRYRRTELASRLLAAGFRVERLSYFNTLLFPPIAAVRLAMRPFLSKTSEGGSDLAVKLPFGLDEVLYRSFAVERHLLDRRDLPFGVSLLGLARPEAPA